MSINGAEGITLKIFEWWCKPISKLVLNPFLIKLLKLAVSTDWKSIEL